MKKIYPTADVDYPDLTLKSPNKKKYKSVKFCNNVKIGKNSIIGANTIIEHDVKLDMKCKNIIILNFHKGRL